ncbi:MAG: CBU_0592 family membrane protein [Gammaproteobacteria bacterium]
MYNFLEYYADAAGLSGVTMVLVAYYLLNIKTLASDDIKYVLMNLAGSVLLLYSLAFHWNLASVLIEIAWILISMIGAYRYFAKRKRKKNFHLNIVELKPIKKILK